MEVIIFGLPIAAIILYVNTVGVLIRIKNNEDTSTNTIFGSLSFAFVLFTLMYVILLGAN